MSTDSEVFHGIRCDFPECGELYESGGEYTYSTDPDRGEAREDGWLVDFEGKDYCSAHVVVPAVPDEDDEEHDGMRPMEATLSNIIAMKIRRATRNSWWKFDAAIRKLDDDRQNDRRSAQLADQSARRRRIRDYLDADPVLAELKPAHLAYGEREMEARREAQKLFGSEW